MADTITFFAQISSFFSALWACVFRMLSLKIHSDDDLEVGIPSVEKQVSDHLKTALPVVSTPSVDGFVDISLNPDSKIEEVKAVPLATHPVPSKDNIIDTAVNVDRPVPVSFPAVHMITQVLAVDDRSKHWAIQFGPYSVYHDHPKRSHSDSFSDLLDQLPDPPNAKLRRHRDSFSDLLDQFPVPPTYIPVPPTHISRSDPVIKEDVVIVEETAFVPAENCPSPTMSEESTIDSSSGSDNNLSTDPSISISISISISNETANTSIHEIESLPCTSAIFQVLSSGIDVKNKNIARFTLIHNPETVLPATDVSGCIQSQSLCAFPALPEAELQSLHDKYSLAPIHNPEDSSRQCLDKHTSIRAPVQVVPTLSTKWKRPFIAPLRIVKKNKVPTQPVVAPLESPTARRRLSGNWEQAIDGVLQAFRDAETEDRDFRDLFSGDGDDSFISQSSVSNVSGDNRGDLDGGDGDCEDCGRQMEDSFYSMEDLSRAMATPPDLVTLKIEDASVSLSSELAVAQQIMEVKDKFNDVDLPDPRICKCEGCEEEEDYSWIAVTDDGDDSCSQEDDQWSDRLELNEYVSS